MQWMWVIWQESAALEASRTLEGMHTIHGLFIQNIVKSAWPYDKLLNYLDRVVYSL